MITELRGYKFSPGLNVIMGASGNGKSRVLSTLREFATNKEGRFVYVPSDDESDAPLKQDIFNRLSQFFPHSEVCSGRSKSHKEPLSDSQQALHPLFSALKDPAFAQGAMIFWHNPELYQNPSSCVTIGEILLDIQRLGVQVFIETNDYFVVKTIDLGQKKGDQVQFLWINGAGFFHIDTSLRNLTVNIFEDAIRRLFDMEMRGPRR